MHSNRPFSCLFSILLSLAVGCSDGPRGRAPGQEHGDTQALGDAEVEAALAGGRRLPPEYLVQAMPMPVRVAASPQDVAKRLADDPALEPLRDALADAGWTSDEAAQLTYVASLHNSGQPGDSIAERNAQVRSSFKSAIHEFDARLAEYEQEHGIHIDRALLKKHGIILDAGPDSAAEVVP